MNHLHCTRRTIVAAALGLTIGGPAAHAGDFRYRPDAAAGWPANVISHVQRRLTERAFDPGPVDGIYGPKTAEAIREFQAANGIEATGEVSEALIALLDGEASG